MTRTGATVGAFSAGDATVAGHATASGHAPTEVVIPGYRIVRCLGRGGMGEVYEGVQESTGRRVAIKMMLEAALASEAGRKRFEREVEVVARLEHPGIVSIIDSGVRRGQYYFVMEFVEGRTLDNAIRPGECGVREALSTVADVCDVVDYAHQRGILHRDLKPGNILVEASGRVRLLDFGIAQVIDDSAAARETVSSPGQVIGTLAYMSPEQAAGKIQDLSVRTDVYALGAIAYELVTGRLPILSEGSIGQMLARIETVDPPRPSSVRKGLGRDIDAVVMKALEKPVLRRYATVGEFAADIRRLLAGEPVTARPVGAVGRTWRWVRRNRTVSAVGAASVVILAVVSSGLIWRIVRERDLAVQNFQQLKGVLESADPDQADGGGTIPQLMDRAVRELDQNPPRDVRSEADVREIVGTVYRKFGIYDKAAENQRRVLEIRRADASGDDGSVAEAMHNLAATLWWDGKYADAEPIYAEALAMRRRLFKGDNPAVAFSMTHLAACRLRLGNVESARSLYKEALDMRTRLYGKEHEQVAQSLNNLAKCEMETDSLAEAERSFRAALAMITKLRGERHLGTASASANLGECLLLAARVQRLDGDAAAARRHAEEALEMYRRAFDIRAAVFTKGHPLSAVSLGGMSRAYLLLDRLEESRDSADEALRMIARTQRPDHPDNLDLLAAIAAAHAASGDNAAAAEEFARAERIAGKLRTGAQVRTAELRSELGLVLTRSGRAEEGLSMLRESSEVLAAAKGERSLTAREAAARLREAEELTAKLKPRGVVGGG